MLKFLYNEFNFADVSAYHVHELEMLQSMLHTGVGCSNESCSDALGLLKRRVIDVPQNESSFFYAIADQVQYHPNCQEVVTGNGLRILTQQFIAGKRKIIEVTILFESICFTNIQ